MRPYGSRIGAGSRLPKLPQVGREQRQCPAYRPQGCLSVSCNRHHATETGTGAAIQSRGNSGKQLPGLADGAAATGLVSSTSARRNVRQGDGVAGSRETATNAAHPTHPAQWHATSHRGKQAISSLNTVSSSVLREWLRRPAEFQNGLAERLPAWLLLLGPPSCLVPVRPTLLKRSLQAPKPKQRRLVELLGAASMANDFLFHLRVRF